MVSEVGHAFDTDFGIANHILTNPVRSRIGDTVTERSKLHGERGAGHADLRMMAYRPDASDYRMAVMVVLADIMELIRKYSTCRVECTET